jgi:CheY-like chemotaxis protein
MTDSAKHDQNEQHAIKKIALIVDDSSTARQLLKKLLESYGHEVLCAESAEIAIQMLNQTHQTHPDVIFMDHNMPGMDGLQALKTIKTNPRTAMIPILMYTSQGDSVYAEQAKRFGAVGIIPKELKHVALKEVLDTLDKIITKSKQGESEYNENNFPAEGPILTESIHPTKPLQTPLYATPPKPEALVPPPTRLRNRTSIALENTEAMLEKSLSEGNKENKIPHPKSQSKSEAQSKSEESTAENQQKPLWINSVQLLQQQNHDIQLQLIRSQQEFQHNLGRIKIWILLITTTLLAVNILLWLNPFATLDTSIITKQYHAQRLDDSRPKQDASTDVNNKTVEVSTSDNQQQLLQQQLPLIQNLLNQGIPFKFGSPPFNDIQAKNVELLLTLLPTIGFSGTIQLTAFFTDFCVTEQGGTLELANENLPIEQCQFFSIDTMSYSDLQSLEFSNLLGTTNLHPDINISVTVQEDLTDSTNKPDRNSVKTAGNWNQLIARHNRVEFQLINESN